jgi:hypothetical protein
MEKVALQIVEVEKVSAFQVGREKRFVVGDDDVWN